jgi:hypothetical protein
MKLLQTTKPPTRSLRDLEQEMLLRKKTKTMLQDAAAREEKLLDRMFCWMAWVEISEQEITTLPACPRREEALSFHAYCKTQAEQVCAVIHQLRSHPLDPVAFLPMPPMHPTVASLMDTYKAEYEALLAPANASIIAAAGVGPLETADPVDDAGTTDAVDDVDGDVDDVVFDDGEGEAKDEEEAVVVDDAKEDTDLEEDADGEDADEDDKDEEAEEEEDEENDEAEEEDEDDDTEADDDLAADTVPPKLMAVTRPPTRMTTTTPTPPMRMLIKMKTKTTPTTTTTTPTMATNKTKLTKTTPKTMKQKLKKKQTKQTKKTKKKKKTKQQMQFALITTTPPPQQFLPLRPPRAPSGVWRLSTLMTLASQPADTTSRQPPPPSPIVPASGVPKLPLASCLLAL